MRRQPSNPAASSSAPIVTSMRMPRCEARGWQHIRSGQRQDASLRARVAPRGDGLWRRTGDGHTSIPVALPIAVSDSSLTHCRIHIDSLTEGIGTYRNRHRRDPLSLRRMPCLSVCHVLSMKRNEPIWTASQRVDLLATGITVDGKVHEPVAFLSVRL